jgi:hypothetical protein
VSRWKAIVSLLCLAIWLPATQHCRLENLPGLAFLQCAGDADGQPDCQGDSCDAVERGVYKTPDSSDVAAAFLAVVLDYVPVLIVEPAEASCPAPIVGDERALLSQTWQSYSVLAVPIRGPSLLS